MKIDTTPRCCSALTQVTTAGGCSSAPKASVRGFFFAAISARGDQNLKRARGAVASAEVMRGSCSDRGGDQSGQPIARARQGYEWWFERSLPARDLVRPTFARRSVDQ